MVPFYDFEESVPEREGVSSRELLAFLDEAERERLEIHSLLLLRRDKLIFKGYWKPFGPEKVHRICSAGKALVAAAVLFAVQEGRLNLDDRVLSFFPELSDCSQKWADRVTVYHLLTMRAGHREDSYSDMMASPEPVAAFFQKPLIDMPGTRFFYDNGIPDVLAEIVRRTSGESLFGYLSRCLFQPLGITRARMETRDGREELATFCLTTPDFLKITRFFAEGGCYRGQRLLRKDLAEAACAWQAPTAGAEAAETEEAEAGYGFQIWRNPFGGFCLNGGAGQMGIVVPDMDLTAVFQANEPRAERIRTLLWRHLRRGISARPLPEDPEAFALLTRRTEGLRLGPDATIPPGAPVFGEYRLDQPFYGLDRLSVQPEREGIRLSVMAGGKAWSELLPGDGRWIESRIPLRFPEMEDPREHRRTEYGLRLDTNVGYDPQEGYVAGFWTGETQFEVWFRSDAWMGSHILTLELSREQALLLTQENGISYRLRRSPPETAGSGLRGCVHVFYTRGEKCSNE